MNLLTIERLTKSYTDKKILEETGFSIQSGEKIGIVGLNGTGKSTLLKIVAGEEEPDYGEVIKGSNIKIGYLKQTPQFETNISVMDAVLDGTNQNDMHYITRARSFLQKLGFENIDQKVDNLSGGQKKRVALIKTLLEDVDILVLDEPTNHLDHEMSEWLEGQLIQYRGAIVMVTHDRWFLDSIVTRITEVNCGKLYNYPGSYSEYISLKIKRQNMEQASERKRQSILTKELAWLHRGARARSTKQKAHIKRIELMENEKAPEVLRQVELDSIATRMGKKTIELTNLGKKFEEIPLFKDFNYVFLRNDRIGIIGPNGCGKSTLLKIISGEIPEYDGKIEIGDTIKIGYFAQENFHMDEQINAIDYVKEVGEYIKTNDGSISASMLMERFLFDKTMQWTRIGKLSGGERRRLYLMRILMEAPNFLILDEPTNDLDIQTLTILEDYLDSFPGIVLAVSHDRYFLDRVVSRIFAFEEGEIRQYEGGYVDYLNVSKSDNTINSNTNEVNLKQQKKKVRMKSIDQRIKFTYNEKREYETIDDDIKKIEQKLERVQQEMDKFSTNSLKLNELLDEQSVLEQNLEEKMERWVYLQELAEKIQTYESEK